MMSITVCDSSFLHIYSECTFKRRRGKRSHPSTYHNHQLCPGHVLVTSQKPNHPSTITSIALRIVAGRCVDYQHAAGDQKLLPSDLPFPGSEEGSGGAAGFSRPGWRWWVLEAGGGHLAGPPHHWLLASEPAPCAQSDRLKEAFQMCTWGSCRAAQLCSWVRYNMWGSLIPLRMRKLLLIMLSNALYQHVNNFSLQAITKDFSTET